MERVDTPVFISYARRTARPYAEKLYEALGGAGGFAFLDTAEIEAGEHFPSALGEAVLRSRVVLAFLDETYFNRWYCLRELQLSLSPFDALWRRGSVSDADKERALAHIVLALPAAGCALQAMDNLPPVLRNTDWPPASDTHRLAELVRGRLERCPDTIAERCRQRGVGTSRLASLLEEAALPTPRNLSGVPLFPPEIAPSLGAAFVGRADDLWRIHFILSTFRGEAATAAALSGALEGTAGSGKTQLAIEYVWRFGPPCYTGGIFWIDADVSEERLTERFHGILQKLDATTPDLAVFLESGRSASRELARALQNLPPSLPVLFVVDNVPEPKPGTAPRPLNTWCPVLGRVTVLATSRFRLSLDARVQALPVQPLAPAGAVNLLTRDVMRSRLDDGSWGCIAEWVGNLPLALTVLNRAIVAGVLDPRELVRNVELAQPTEVIDRQAELLRDQVPEGMLRGVTEALSLSYERLSEPQQLAVRLLAQLAAQPIPEHLLDAFGDVFSPAVRSALTARSFVTPLEGSGLRFFGQMHRLVADFARTRAAHQGAELDRAATALLQAMPRDALGSPAVWPSMTACVPHAEQVFDRLEQASVPAWREHAAELGLRLAEFLHLQGRAVSASVLARRTAAVAELALGKEHYITLASITLLAVILRAQGHLGAARDLQERALVASRGLLGDEHPHTLTAMNNLALTLQALGDLAGAHTLHGQGLPICRRVLGEDHPQTLRSMSNFAETLYAEGDLAGARTLHEQSLAGKRRVLGDEHSSTLTSMHNLALTLQGLGELAGALRLQRQVIAKRRALLGEDHPDTLVAMDGLAQMLQAEGDLTGARALHMQVLATHRRLLGEEHPHTLNSLINLAVTLAAQGDLAGARHIEAEVLATRRRIWGEEHPDTVTVMNNLATTLQAMGDLAGARALYEHVLAARQAALGDGHPDTLAAMNNLAGILYAQGDLRGARTLQERVVDGNRQVLGGDHAATLAAASNLAEMLRALGELDSAFRRSQQVVTASHRVHGAEHAATLTAMSIHALIVKALGDVATAATLQADVLEKRRRVLGEEHPDTLIAMNNLAQTLHDRGDLAGACALQEGVLAVIRRVHGEAHPNTLTAMSNLALMRLYGGDLHGARALQEEVLVARRALLGDEHPATLTVMNNLAVVLYQLGDFAGACRLLEQVVAGRHRVLGSDHPDTLVAVASLKALVERSS